MNTAASSLLSTASATAATSNSLATTPLAPTNDALKFFLANVGFSQTAPQIKSYIDQYFGPVNFVKLIPHRDPSSTGGAATKHRGYGFLYMLTEEGGAALESYANAFPGNKIRLLDREGVYVAKHDEGRVAHGQGQAQGQGDASAYAAAATTATVATGYSATSTTPYSYEGVNVTAGSGYAQYYDPAMASQQPTSVANYPAYYTQQSTQPQQQQQVYSNVPQQTQSLVPTASQQYSYAAVPASSSSYVSGTPSSGAVAPTMVDNRYDRPPAMSQHYTAPSAVLAVSSAASYSQPSQQATGTTMGYLQPPQQQQQPAAQQPALQQPTMTYPNTVYPPPQQQQQQPQQQYPQPQMYHPPMDGYIPPPAMDGYNTPQGYPTYNLPARPMHGQQQPHPPQQRQQLQHGRGYPHPSGGTKYPRNVSRGGRGQLMSRGGGPNGGRDGMRMSGPPMGGRGAPPPPPPMSMGGPMSGSMGMPPPPPPPSRGARGRGGGRMSVHQGGRQGGRNRDLRRDRPY